jgi:ribonuclease HI/retron-type reverse transcriptase
MHTYIVLVQEPWIRNKQVSGLTGQGRTVIADERSERPRTCIVLSNNLSKVILISYTNQDLVTIKLKLKCKENVLKDIVIASSYLPYEDCNPPNNKFKNLVETCGRGNLPLIIGCDANAHQEAWGSTDTNQRGVDLFDFAIENHLLVANVGNQPTFSTHLREEVIDFTFTNLLSNDLIKEWVVLQGESLSDHKKIKFYLEDVESTPVEYRNPKSTDWGEFKFVVQELLIEQNMDAWLQNNELSCSQIDEYNSLLTSIMLEAYERVCPLRVSKGGTTKCSWWNWKLKKFRTKVNRASMKAKRSVGNWNYELLLLEFRNLRRDYKKAINEAKTGAWEKFCEEATDLSSTAKLTKILRKDKDAKLNALFDGNGKFSQSREDVLNILINTHFKDSLPVLVPTQDVVESGRDWDHNTEIIDAIVADSKIEWAVSKFEKYKMEGPDGIFPALLQNCLEYILPHLSILYKACLNRSYVPRPWRKVNVKFIPKPGKSSYYDPKSFRPISLSSFLLKTLERLLDMHIRHTLLVNCPLSLRQHAYIPGRSTETALSEITKEIKRARKQDNLVLAAFLDIEGAFDNTRCSSIIDALNLRSSEKCVTSIVERMLTDREVTLKFENQSLTRKVIKGCPQGGVLSPILWNLVVDELIVNLNNSGFFCQGYADDVVILVKGRHLNTLSDLLNNAFSKTEKWCKAKGLSVNPDKTKLILFSNRRNPKITRGPVLLKRTLPLSNEVKYLGVIFDCKLNWNRNVEERMKKSNNILWQCRRAIAPKWGLGPKQTSWIYTAIVRPTLVYGCVIWYRYCDYNCNVKKLDKVNRTACRLISGSMKSTPGAALELILGIEPLDVYILKMALNAGYRLMSSPTNVKYLGTELKAKLLESTVSAPMPTDFILPFRQFEKKFWIVIPQEIQKESNFNDTDDNIRCYTDGSLHDSGVGAGFVLYHNDSLIKKEALTLHTDCTIFQAEIYAILCAAFYLLRFSKCRITIFSDSQAALKALASKEVYSKLVSACIQAINDVGKSNTCSLQWVPGHSGIIGNELADEQANIGSYQTFVGPKPSLPIPRSIVKLEIIQHCNEIVNLRWGRLNSCRQTKIFFPEIDKKRTKLLMNMNRTNLKLLISVYTGHCGLRKHLCTLGLSDEPTCPKCGEADDAPEHLIANCRYYSKIREEFLGHTRLGSLELKCTNVHNLLGFLHASERFRIQC